jgi:hypothetical protein
MAEAIDILIAIALRTPVKTMLVPHQKRNVSKICEAEISEWGNQANSMNQICDQCQSTWLFLQ